MPRQSSLPPIFSAYRDRVDFCQQESGSTWTSTCPRCGGEPHQDGEWPDRCTWFLDDHPLGWCRRCGGLFFPDADGVTPPSKDDLEQWRRKREDAEERRKRAAEMALRRLRSSQLWEEYHAQLDAFARRWWRSRGVPEFLQDYLQLGYDPAHEFYHGGQPINLATATIPVFGPGWQALNVKHRIIEPPPGFAKYRYELSGQTGLVYRTEPDMPLDGGVIAVEGEIKAMVLHLYVSDTAVIGLPGATPGPEVLAQLRDAKRITLVVDPDARQKAWALCKKLGRERCWVLIPPMKIDDGIIEGELNESDVRTLLKQAVHAR